MRWIRALDLQNWSQTLQARSALPELVADLIRASSANISSFRFPSGDKGQVRGFDGWLESEKGLFVPGGTSIWEFGASEGFSKADKDYAKRKAGLSPELMSELTFVYVTLITVDNPQKKREDWIEEKKALADFKDVIFLDGAMLELWLASCPAVAARYARFELKVFPQIGARSIEEFWFEYSNRFKPQLTEEVLLCERSQASESLLRYLLGGPAGFRIAADSPDEVIAFAVAAIRKTQPDLSLYLSSRTLVLDTEEAARFFLHTPSFIFFPRGQARQVSGALAQSGPTLVALGADQQNSGAELLPRASSFNLANAIKTMGYDDDRAREIARSCGRSVTILSRQIAAGDRPHPEWVGDAQNLLPAFLAGGWDARSTYDQNIVAQLSGEASYLGYEGQLRRFVRMQDPPLDQEQTVWKIRAPVDAFVHIGHLIGPEHLDRLKAAATVVFSELERPINPDAPFSLDRGREDGHSSWLRDGLATTLLLIAALADEARLVTVGYTPQAFVDEIVGSLPGLSTDYRVIASLRHQLPLLAEAAPNPLLSALEQMLEGDGDQIRPIFSESDDFLAPGSPHTNLLWALETLAWDPTLLRRVSLILAGLARVDPGGRLSNRPINSLRAIFLSWTPNTNAVLATRLSVIDSILRREPEVGWDLLSKLLPRSHDTSTPASKPRYRESGASDRNPMTWGEVWESQREIVVRALKIAGDSPGRWCTIIDRMSSFEPESVKASLELIDAFLAKSSADASRQVWAKLRDERNRHLAFAHADWAMKAETLEEVDKIVLRHQPDDLVERLRWLFDDWTPDVPNRQREGLHYATPERQSALKQLLEQGGVDSLLEMGDKAKLPQFVAQTLVEISEETDLPAQIITETIRRGNHQSYLAQVISGASAFKFRQRWADTFTELASAEGWPPDITAHLLLNWPDIKETWSYVASFGSVVDLLYWQGKGAWHFEGDLDDVIYGAERLISVGRATSAIQATHHRVKELPPQLIFKMLDNAIGEINSNPKQVNNMTSYYIEEIFKILNERDDMEKLEIARREYAYLPMFAHDEKQLNLHKFMAEDPTFYVSVLCDVFRRRGQSAEEVDQSVEAQNKARAGYQLLSTFRILPGSNSGDVNFDQLKAWVVESLRLCRDEDRAEIGGQYIGHVLAHSPRDPQDGGWPHRSVRTLIEELDSDNLETGILIERFNMRGVWSKAVFEGGDQERDLASRYFGWSEIATPWVRTAALLKKMADGWVSEGNQADVRARQDKLREV